MPKTTNTPPRYAAQMYPHSELKKQVRNYAETLSAFSVVRDEFFTRSQRPEKNE